MSKVKLTVTFLICLVLGAIAWGWAQSNTQAVPPLGGKKERDLTQIRGTFAPLVDKSLPAVASVITSRVVRAPRMPELPFGPGFRDFFGDREWGGSQPESRQRGLGSAVIVGAGGLLLTNHHVVDGASGIEVRLRDQRTFEAKVIGSDPQSDIAVLSIEQKDLPVLPLGNSDNARVGDLVLAIGNPFGVGQTVTMGIVGATGRGGLNPESYEDFIQTDAAINPGNSGGPLVDSGGNLIGINTAILSRTGGYEGVGFAVPVNMAHFVMKQIVEKGKVTRGFIGINIQDVTAALSRTFKAPDTAGALVAGVTEGSPGDKAGLQRGDIIRQVDGATVQDSRQLRALIGSKPPGVPVKLSILRGGEQREVTVNLTEAPQGMPEVSGKPAGGGSVLEGVFVDELRPQVAGQLGLLPNTKGVVVTNVDAASPAAAAGLRRGDVIQEVNRRPVTDPASYRAAVGQSAGQVLLLVNRGNSTIYLAVENNRNQ